MSTSRGNTNRNRPQKHQNKTAFKNDLHDTSRKTKMMNSLDVCGVCKRCKEIIQWKIKYKKYKPLTSPGKCVSCGEKAIKHAYHVMCSKCAGQKNVCAKCCKAVTDNDSQVDDFQSDMNLELQTALKGLPERKRRTVMRYINKHGGDSKATPEIMSLIEDVLAGVNKINFEDDFDFSDNDLSDECEDK